MELVCYLGIMYCSKFQCLYFPEMTEVLIKQICSTADLGYWHWTTKCKAGYYHHISLWKGIRDVAFYSSTVSLMNQLRWLVWLRVGQLRLNSWQEKWFYFLLLPCPEWLWGSLNILFNGYRGPFSHGFCSWSIKLTTHLHIVLKFRMLWSLTSSI
jgi:hypothetical protein